MKLGLIIKLTSGGEQEVFAVNKQQEWAKFAADSRSIIKDLSGFDGSGKSVIIVKILGQLGYLVGLIKARPAGSGRANDNTTAWIHVPAKMDMSGTELAEVIKATEAQLSAPLGIDQKSINELFSKEYPEKEDLLYPALAFIGPNPEGVIGWRKYGQGTGYALPELLGDSIAQICYKKYKCLCFIEASLGLSMLGGEEITEAVKEVTKIKVPVDDNGFKPTIKTGSGIPFDKDIEIPADLPLRVIWRKTGYADIEKDIHDFAIYEHERKPVFIFKRSWIKVTNSKSKNLDNAEIRVNNLPFTGDTMEIPGTDGSIKIRVSCKGYNPKEETVQISQIAALTSPSIGIKLEEEKYSKEYRLRYEEKKESKGGKENIEGYIIEGCILIGFAVVLALLMWAYEASKTSNSETQKKEKTLGAKYENKSNHAAPRNYLSKNLSGKKMSLKNIS